MFALIESCPEQRPDFGWTGKLISITVHAFVISAAIAFTNRVVAGAPYQPPIVVTHWQDRLPPSPLAPAPGNDAVPIEPGHLPLTSLVAPIITPADIPPPGPVDFTEPGTRETTPPGSRPGGDPPGVAVSPDAPRDVRVVDVLPVLLSHPEIHYPEALRQAGVEGRVLVETVLDSLGRAEPALTRVVQSGSPLFDREAVSVVLASRYRAARVDGHAVRVRIAVPVNFTIAR